MYSALCWQSLRAPQPDGRRKASSLGSRPLPLHPSAEKPQSLRGFPKQPRVRWKSKGHTLNSGRLAQPCFWHFVGQRALEHLLGWEREGYANCTLVAAEAAKKWGGHLTAL